jgi:hypothetical protein
MTGTNCDLFTHNQSRSYLNHLVKPNSCFDFGSCYSFLQDVFSYLLLRTQFMYSPFLVTLAAHRG